jgi:ElaA protein
VTLSWTWRRFPDLGVDDLYDLLALRCRVFILEQGPYQDLDGIDRRAWHLLGRDEAGEARACLRIVDPGVKYAEPSMGRVVLDKALRGSGLADELVAEGLARADNVWPGRGNRISAQAHLQPFYEGLGYRAIGEPYGEDGIPHREMLRPAPQARFTPIPDIQRGRS